MKFRLSGPMSNQAFLNDPINHRPLGAEVLDDFIDRVSLAYDETIGRYRNKHCPIVAHAGVICVIIAKTIHAISMPLSNQNQQWWRYPYSPRRNGWIAGSTELEALEQRTELRARY